MAARNELRTQFSSERGRSRERVRTWIEVRGLKAGDALPPEMAIANELGISQPSVNRALRQLEKEGHLQLRGRRRVVAGREPGRLSRTVLLIASSGHVRGPVGQHSTGWEWHIAFNALTEAQALGHSVLSLHNADVSHDELRGWLAERPAGVLVHGPDLVSSGQLDYLQLAVERGIPMVVYGPGSRFSDYDTVFSDQEQGTYEATRALLEMGCRRPLRGWASDWLPDRDRGYERACAEAGIEPLAFLQEGFMSDPGDPVRQYHLRRHYFAGLLLKYLRVGRPIDAVLAASDGDVAALASAIREHGLEPNRDILLAGYDRYWEDIHERRFENTPPLLTVDRRNPDVGRAMAQLLQERIRGELPPTPVHRVVSPLLVRYSPDRLAPLPEAYAVGQIEAEGAHVAQE